MDKIKKYWKTFYDKYLSTTAQLKRVIILTSVLLTVAVLSFGSYYYLDRYYTSQPKTAEVMISEAEKAVRDDSQNPNLRLNLAETYLLNRRYDDAITQAEQVRSIYPDNQRSWFVIGIAHALSGRPVDAIDPLQKYVDANKDSEMPGLNKSLQAAAYYLGDSYLQLGKPQEAIAPLEMAVNWSVTDADSMYKLGMAYLGVKDYEKAVNMFHGATTFVPNYLEAYDAMTAAYVAMDKPDLANYSRGMAAYSKKDYTKARDLLLQSAQAKPDFPLIFAGLGRVYEALNDLPNAKLAYETALKLDANNFNASVGLQRVKALLNK